MARWRRIDAPRDDGVRLLDERASLEGDTGERSDVSRAQGFTRGDGAGQHHRALSTLGIFVPMGVGGFPRRGLRCSVVVCHRGFVWPLDHRSARRAPNRGDMGPREGQEGEEGEEAVHGGKMPVVGWREQVFRQGSSTAPALAAGQRTTASFDDGSHAGLRHAHRARTGSETLTLRQGYGGHAITRSFGFRRRPMPHPLLRPPGRAPCSTARRLRLAGRRNVPQV